jgi:transposase, IS30 family
MAAGRGSFRWLTPVERAAMAARFRAGARVADVVAEFDVPRTSAARIRDADALARRRVWHSPHRLSFVEREEVFAGICRGESDGVIARRLGRQRSTIGREIGRCGGRGRYRPLRAEWLAQRLARRPKQTKLAGCRRLLAAVEQGLERCWSPQQIAARLRLEHPDDPLMRISHETIYRSLYVQARGELRRQLTAQLRSGRSTRRTRGRVETRGRIVGMVPIANRPPEVDERRVPGHWEGDLLMGGAGKSAIATLVERHTRSVLLARLADGRGTEQVIEALKTRIEELPAHLLRSLTWDRGKELSAHQRFTVDTGVPVYFCDPHSPWQRGSNENTNGLLRQYLPKGTDLAVHDQAALDAIAAELNGRPRKTLARATPAEKMQALLR